MERFRARGSHGERLMAIVWVLNGVTMSPPLRLCLICHNREPRSLLIIIETSITSLPRKKSVDTILAWCRHRVLSRVVTLRFTASAFSLSEPRRNKISRTVGVVCAIAEFKGDRAYGCGDTVIAWSKNCNSSVGLFVFAHRWGRIGHNQLFSEIIMTFLYLFIRRNLHMTFIHWFLCRLIHYGNCKALYLHMTALCFMWRNHGSATKWRA